MKLKIYVPHFRGFNQQQRNTLFAFFLLEAVNTVVAASVHDGKEKFVASASGRSKPFSIRDRSRSVQKCRTKKVEKKLADLGIVRKALLMTCNSVEQFVTNFDADRDSCQIPVRLENLDRVYRDFLKVQGEIEKHDAAERLEEHLSERVVFKGRYCAAKGFLLSNRAVDLNQTVLNATVHQPEAPVHGTFHLRLPQIDLPKFSGDFSKWLSFRDTYASMVHSNADIPTVAKLQYLIQSLEGEARKPFESVDIEADNYAAVWDALLKSIYDLPAVKKESADSLQELVDEFQRHVKALAKLNEPVQHWDTPLVNLLSYKLDPSTLRAWEEKTSQEEDVKYNDLVEFLYQRVRILKSVASDISQRSQQVPAKVAGVVPPPKRQFPSKFAANVVASDAKPNAPSCFACSDRHFLFQCQSFAKMPVSQRRDLVSQRKLCWNCFRTGHQARSCTSKFSCRSCRDRHHTLLLHDPSQPGKSSSAPAVTSKSHEALSVPSTSAPGPASTSQQVSMSVQSQASTVLLQTVALHVVDVHGKSFEARALLDSGSMSNFMSSELANLLAIPQSEADVSVAGIGQSHSRLELCAAHLSTQLYQKVASALKTVPPAYFWSDSTTVIQWLRSSPGRWKTFVANRVSQIQAATPFDKWNHVAGADNPADDISRGLDPSDLLTKERWWTGPA
nr:uncharacterized protein LOC115255457 [Aedes albopictus]